MWPKNPEQFCLKETDNEFDVGMVLLVKATKTTTRIPKTCNLTSKTL